MTDIPELPNTRDDNYNVLVRFRCEKDFLDFIKLIDQPRLAVYNRTLIRSTVWPIEVSENNLFEY